MRRISAITIISLIFSLLPVQSSSQQSVYDLLIKGGQVLILMAVEEFFDVGGVHHDAFGRHLFFSRRLPVLNLAKHVRALASADFHHEVMTLAL